MQHLGLRVKDGTQIPPADSPREFHVFARRFREILVEPAESEEDAAPHGQVAAPEIVPVQILDLLGKRIITRIGTDRAPFHDLGLGMRCNRLEPAGLRHAIVIQENQPVARGGTGAVVSIRRGSLAWSGEVLRSREIARQHLTHGVISTVVGHDHIGSRRQGAQAAREFRGSAASRNDNGNQHPFSVRSKALSPGQRRCLAGARSHEP